MASFFGFETTMPGRGAPRPTAGGGTHNSRRGGRGGGDAFGEELGGQFEADSDDAFSGSKLDEQMERKFAYGQHEAGVDEGNNDINALEDDNEDLNDETFGDVASDRDKLGNDFDFSAGNARISGAPLPRDPPSQYRPAGVRAALTDDRGFNLQRMDAAGEAEQYRDQWEPNARESIQRRPSELNRDNLAEIWTKPASPTVQDMHMNGAPQFQQQHYSPQLGYPPPPPPSQQQRPMSVSDIEAMMLRMQRAKVDHRHATDPDSVRTPREPTRPNQGFPPPPGMYNHLVDMNAPINAAELEAEYRARQAPRGHPQQQFMNQHSAMAMAMRQGSPPLQHLQQQHLQQQQQQQQHRPQGALQNEQMGTPPRIESPIMYPDADRGYDDHHVQRGPRPPMQLGNFLPQSHHEHQHQRGNQNRPMQGYARMDQRYVHRAYPDNRPDIRTREEKYKGTMTQYEKELIAKIQISQLVTDNPYRDDFYYIVYTSLTAANEQAADESGKAPKGLNWQQSLLMDQTRGNGPNVTNRMQQQMQRLIEGRKAKPKGNSLSLEGALGKISLSSVRNPRQLLQVKGPSSPKDGKALSAHDSPLLTTKQLLRRIENVYSKVLELEIMKRAGPPAARVENNVDDATDNIEGRDEAKDSEQEWTARFEEHRANMWKELGVSEQVPLNYPHPFTALLAFGKGKKVIPRVFRFLTRDQSLALISTLLSRLETLDVCQPPAAGAGAATSAHAADVELFMANVVPTVVSVVMECPLFVVNACMRILLERHNMVWLAKSKPGLAFLTMFLSRAEMIKQGAGAGGGSDFSVPEQELHMWTEIYNFLFASLHNHFSSLFPSSSSPPPSLTPNTEAVSAGATPANVAGDVYVWQFLAALAVGATTVEHQRVLLTEVRDKVLETARRSDDAKSLANVDLFLNALGLGIDARQLVNMSGF
ncbi:hypothetical protein HDU87_002145 [Geranomyces variabilis]|uniref:mRNA decay factor PAT1 domain-containing protein n=1 Tax=Geranomyces variabilis TaxID=109894 RepID=A0AAD5TLI7_9FUNG|nr:hypothetical protein HDU87_002145 [Geranomyces variabilis]